MKCLLSYPRSGNHLVRFFIELLSEEPTLGCIENNKDLPIYLNEFNEDIPFNIKSTDDINNDSFIYNNLYVKYHRCPDEIPTELIFILRNPIEALISNNKYNYNEEEYNHYFTLIDYYNNFNGKKIIFFYENIIKNNSKFIIDLYNFMDLKNESKKDYVISNIDKLFNLSKYGKNRDWNGINSNTPNYHYARLKNNILQRDFKNKLLQNIKNKIYNNLDNELYSFIQKRYKLF
jgi:hypothetical protein